MTLPDTDSIRSVHVFHLNHLGDMVFSLPLLASIRHAFPKARIVSILRPPGIELWQMAGLADEYLVRSKSRGFKKIYSMRRALRKRRPDLTFVLSQAFEPCLLAWLSGSRRRVGFTRTKLGWLLTDHVAVSGPPSMDRNVRLLEALDIRPHKSDYVGLLHPPVGEIRRMNVRLAEAGIPTYKRLIVLHPGASPRRSVKEWTDEGFAEVAEHFLSSPDTGVVFTGTSPVDSILRMVNGPAIDLTCRTSIPELAALLDRADMFIGVDSGALHIAAALGTKVVGLYGASDPEITGPSGKGHRVVRHPVECSPCFRPTCPIGRPCMLNITARQVIEAAESAFAECSGNGPRTLPR